MTAKNRISNEFLKAIIGFKRQSGCYNVVVVNNKNGERCETQGDLGIDDTWFTFMRWLIGDMCEMNIGRLEDLSIESVSFAEAENYCGELTA